MNETKEALDRMAELDESNRIRVGAKIGKLTVLAREDQITGDRSRITWRALCDCGKATLVRQDALRRGATRSCGCGEYRFTPETHTTHGLSKKTEYAIWRNMKSRCFNPKSTYFKCYGGRGITVCERWLKFENFMADMGRRPGVKKLDRIDNDGSYGPGNCKWSTDVEQQRNKRSNIVIRFNGEAHTIAAWAEKIGLRTGTLWWRIKSGWTVEDALSRAKRQISRG